MMKQFTESQQNADTLLREIEGDPYQFADVLCSPRMGAILRSVWRWIYERRDYSSVVFLMAFFVWLFVAFGIDIAAHYLCALQK